MYKCFHEQMPFYMKSIFTVHSNSQYSLRSERKGDLVVPKFKNECYKNSFAYSGAKLWNALPMKIRESTSLSEFKLYSFQFFSEKY